MKIFHVSLTAAVAALALGNPASADTLFSERQISLDAALEVAQTAFPAHPGPKAAAARTKDARKPAWKKSPAA
jgi:hypothetical protein